VPLYLFVWASDLTENRFASPAVAGLCFSVQCASDRIAPKSDISVGYGAAANASFPAMVWEIDGFRRDQRPFKPPIREKA